MDNIKDLIGNVDINEYDEEKSLKMIDKSIEVISPLITTYIAIEELNEFLQEIILFENKKGNRINLHEEFFDAKIALIALVRLLKIDNMVSHTHMCHSHEECMMTILLTQKAIIKHLRGKTDIEQITELVIKMAGVLNYIAKYYFLDDTLLKKIEILKIKRLKERMDALL